ncbi:Glucoside xylosyltransferase 1, partial [Orchesella cincta]
IITMLRLRRLLSRSRRRVARYHVLRGIQWGLAIGILVSLGMVLYQFGLIVLDEELEFKSIETTNHTNVTRDDYSTTNWNYIAVKEVIAIPDFDEITDAAFPDSNTPLQIFPLKREPPIVIGLVSCDRIGEYKSAFLATTMIKSVLVSAEIYGVSQVEFHIFIEADTSGYFMSRLQDFGYAKKDRKNRVHVRVNCHPILDAIPENFQKEFLYSRKKAHWRGGFARLLYATNLPAVDSIIHLDTDIIITGDITQLWSFLGKMDDGRMLAVAPAAEPDEKFFDKLYQYHFADIPHVKPWGLNTGGWS